MPTGRYVISNYNTQLEIYNVQQSDEGDYLCQASSVNGVQSHTIHVDVQGKLNTSCLSFHTCCIVTIRTLYLPVCRLNQF